MLTSRVGVERLEKMLDKMHITLRSMETTSASEASYVELDDNCYRIMVLKKFMLKRAGYTNVSD
jgi:hypothetical protein